jgi:hypothetical protein
MILPEIERFYNTKVKELRLEVAMGAMQAAGLGTPTRAKVRVFHAKCLAQVLASSPAPEGKQKIARLDARSPGRDEEMQRALARRAAGGEGQLTVTFGAASAAELQSMFKS